MSFKIALSAGHYKYTAGKCCLKSLDPNETREWVLNNRIADKVEKLLKNYSGYELLRLDDTTGEKDVSLTKRSNAANNFGADFYLSIHHNAGVNGGSGGGIVAFVYTNPSSTSLAWQKELYNALIQKTGLKGNRSTPLAKANLHECREPVMPAVLLELGFMDSRIDVPIILTEKFANQCAEAIVEVIVKRAKLKKKNTSNNVPELTAVETLAQNGVINDPGYWEVAQYNLKYLDSLLVNIAKVAQPKVVSSVKTAKDAINHLVECGVIASPNYWVANYSKVKYLDKLLISAANHIPGKFAPYMVRITADVLNIRKGPSAKYDVVGYIQDEGKGAYTIVEEKSGWGLLKSYSDNRNGWISLAYTKKV